jgi:cell wall-associated NlpC family hydrolase
MTNPAPAVGSAKGTLPVATKLDPRRAALTAEALSWRQTQFVHGQCLKGVAADCSTFLAACFREIGLFQANIPALQPDWFVHTKKEQYLEELQRHAVEFTLKDKQPEPGDIILVKDVALGAKVFSHGAIVLRWGRQPEVIHCFPPCVMTSNPLRFPAFVGKQLKYFDPFAPATHNAPSALPAAGAR